MTDHTYPDRHVPGSHWSTDLAWQILDTLPPGTLDLTQRSYLNGLIAGALMKCAKEGEPKSPIPPAKWPKLR